MKKLAIKLLFVGSLLERAHFSRCMDLCLLWFLTGQNHYTMKPLKKLNNTFPNDGVFLLSLVSKLASGTVFIAKRVGWNVVPNWARAKNQPSVFPLRRLNAPGRLFQT